MSHDVVYHHTDTVHLPWILQAGELRPGANRIGDSPDFLWATRDGRGDHSSASSRPVALTAYRSEQLRRVRFSLQAEDFEPWREIVRRYPGWTAEHIAALEGSGNRLGSSPTTWWCRVDALPRARWLGIETHGYRETGWRPLLRAVCVNDTAGGLGIVIDGKCYLSRRRDTLGSAISYETMVTELPPMCDAAELKQQLSGEEKAMNELSDRDLKEVRSCTTLAIEVVKGFDADIVFSSLLAAIYHKAKKNGDTDDEIADRLIEVAADIQNGEFVIGWVEPEKKS